MEQNINTGVGFTPAPEFVNVVSCASCVTSAPGLKVDTVAHLTVTNNNAFFLRQGTSATTIAVSGLGASATFPALTGPSLAIDMCRNYTFFAEVDPVTSAVTLSVGYGIDFSKHEPTKAGTDQYFLGDGTKAIVGYLYIKNESAGVYIPGTTLLNVAGITTHPADQFGFPLIIA